MPNRLCYDVVVTDSDGSDRILLRTRDRHHAFSVAKRVHGRVELYRKP